MLSITFRVAWPKGETFHCRQAERQASNDISKCRFSKACHHIVRFDQITVVAYGSHTDLYCHLWLFVFPLQVIWSSRNQIQLTCLTYSPAASVSLIVRESDSTNLCLFLDPIYTSGLNANPWVETDFSRRSLAYSGWRYMDAYVVEKAHLTDLVSEQ
jgi:hypothetical protein